MFRLFSKPGNNLHTAEIVDTDLPVVDPYDRHLTLRLRPEQKRDLIEFLKSI